MKQYTKEKLNSLICQELGDIILRNFNTERGDFLTITRVEVNKDASIANVFISIYPDDHAIKVFNDLNKKIYHIQQFLNKRMQRRIVPKIVFKLDHYNQNIENIFKILK